MDNLSEDPATQEPVTETPASEQAEETAASDNSTDGQQEDAAKPAQLPPETVRYIRELEGKVKAKTEPDNRSKEIQELEWKLENKERINLVKTEYETILAEGFNGEKVSKKIALELAEKQAKVDLSGTKRDRQVDMTTPSVTTRNVNPQGYEDELDQRLGLTLERKRKLEERHPHLKEAS